MKHYSESEIYINLISEITERIQQKIMFVHENHEFPYNDFVTFY